MKDRSSMTFSRIASAAAASILLAMAGGCSWFSSTKSAEYKTGTKTAQPLEVPPELTSPTMDDRYAIPDPRAQTSYSQYSQQGAQPRAGESGPTVLPKVEGVRIERAGDQRWLVVKGAPEQVWPVVRQFWIDSGFPLEREQPELGIMETEWHEDREKIPDDILRRTIGKVFDKMWSTPYRDKYRTRLERGAEPNTTDVFISHRGFEEVYTNAQQDDTKWVPVPPNREREAEMLSRLMVKIGAPQEASRRVAASDKSPAPTRATQPPAPEAPKNAVLENNGAGPLVVNDGFDRAWRRVGLALDRVGFTVEDRDRSKGIFFVRYIDPDVDLSKQTAGKTSFWDKLAFWRSPPKSAQPQYRIQVTDAGASSRVVVQDAQGNPEASSTGKKILSLLYDQLK